MNNEIFMTGGNQGTGFQMVADFDGDIDSLFEVSHDGEMPIMLPAILYCIRGY